MSGTKKLTIIVLALAVTVAALTSFIRRQYVVPIIMYHSVSAQADPANRTNVSLVTFERQMCYLKEHRYNVVTLEALAELIKNKKKIPPRSIAITFDDGYQNNYTFAYPVLKKYNLPATIFIILGEVGRPEGDRLDWGQIKQMQASGLITIGSHAIGPEPLVNFKSEKELRRQIYDSQRLLVEKLGVPVRVFSYPGGFFDRKIRGMVIAAGYLAAVATNPGKDFPNDDIFALKRLRISENAGNLFVFWVEVSGFYNYMREHRHK